MADSIVCGGLSRYPQLSRRSQHTDLGRLGGPGTWQWLSWGPGLAESLSGGCSPAIGQLSSESSPGAGGATPRQVAPEAASWGPRLPTGCR